MRFEKGWCGSVEAELVLGFMAAKTVETNPDYFGMVLNDSILEEAGCIIIFGLDRGFRLWPFHFSKGVVEGHHFTDCVVKGT